VIEKTTKERITEAALSLFEQNGFHSVTIDKITQESCTSKGGFYHNFKSKEELLYTIHDSFITYVLDKAEEAYARYDTPTEQLYAIIKSFVMIFDMYRPHVKVFYQESVYLSSHYANLIKQKRDKYTEMMFKIVQDGIDQGEFRKELPVPILSMAMFGMINWIYKWYKSDGIYTVDQIAEIYGDIVLHGILTKDALEKVNNSPFFLKNR
jgi:AcrR family transcriptional regulator